MDNFHINANELVDEETHYELTLRALPVGRDADNRRVLKHWFRNEEMQECPTSRTITDEFPDVQEALKQIENLLKTGQKVGCRSRLLHYYRRLRRCHAFTAQELKNRQVLIDHACRIANSYLQLDLTRIEFFIPFRNSIPRNPFQEASNANITTDTQRTLILPPSAPQLSEAVPVRPSEAVLGGDDEADHNHQ